MSEREDVIEKLREERNNAIEKMIDYIQALSDVVTCDNITEIRRIASNLVKFAHIYEVLSYLIMDIIGEDLSHLIMDIIGEESVVENENQI